MTLRKKIEDKINKKEQEIQDFQTKINEAKAYIQALQETIRLLPKEDSEESAESKIRPTSAMGKTLALLKKTGHPMHLNEILKAIGKTTSKKDRVALSGSLGWYVRKGEVFMRSAPNTFGLIGMESDEEMVPPDDFGLVEEKEKTEHIEKPF